jgi:choline dehydrogenase-like flavoprotein
MSGRIFTAADLKAGREISCDVCVVGSGAGGSIVAAGLAERGLSVVVLEEGGHFGRSDFDGDEAKAYSSFYRDRGMFATADLSMTILQGRTVGGGTTVNWTTCFRTPENILGRWQDLHGSALSTEALIPHWEAVERRLGIKEWPEETVNANNRVLFDGARALGWEVSPMRRNVVGCMNTGYCGLGCPVDGKQGMAITYLKDAVDHGVRIFANTRATRLERQAGRIVAVHAEVLDPITQRPSGVGLLVRPKLVVSSGGAVGSPALLLRSGINSGGRVGKRLWMHPVIGSLARYAHRIDGFYGAPQSSSSHHFIERGPGKIGWFLETPPMQPMLIASATKSLGSELEEVMEHLPYMGSVIAILRDGMLEEEEGGTVSLRSDGRIRVDYAWTPAHTEAFREGTVALTQVCLAAGAIEVSTGHSDPVVVRNESELGLLREAPWGPHHHSIFTAHQMGGCPLGADPATSVVDPSLRHHEVPNLFVVDGSVFPTSLGVNPSLSIYGLAHWATEGVAEAV